MVSYPYAADAGNACLLRTTVGDEDRARLLAKSLVGPKLAACVHIYPVRSFYSWQGASKDEPEWVVEARVPTWLRRHRVKKAMLAGHPYELPMVEMVGTTVTHAYRAWMKRG